MTEADWRMINLRKSCALLTHEQMAEVKSHHAHLLFHHRRGAGAGDAENFA